MAWEGGQAVGPPAAGMAFFPAGADAAGLARLAWGLEENTRKFYLALAGMAGDDSLGNMLQDLAEAEDNHQRKLAGLYLELSGEPLPADDDPTGHNLLEDGTPAGKALSWCQGRPLPELLEWAVAMESNACDRYLKMVAAAGEKQAREMFSTLAAEEQKHLRRLVDLI